MSFGRFHGLLRFLAVGGMGSAGNHAIRVAAETLPSDRPKYWAYISYSHQDRRIARWCRDALSRQRVPRKMRDLVATGSSHLSPVFLDEESVSAAPVLSAELRSALQNSRHLIVICSPFAVASSYVSDEIQYFQSLGRSDRILCLVASGLPNATEKGQPQLECFPEPLRLRISGDAKEPIPAAERPLAAVLGDETLEEKARAIRQIAGGMLGISDSAIRLAATRRTAVLTVIVFAAAMLALAMLVAFVLPWRTYSRDHVRRWGTWQEVDPISAGTSARLPNHFEFVRHGMLGKPSVVRLLDGFGRCTAQGMQDILGHTFESPCNTSRACEAHFSYGQNGDIQTEELVDQYGTVLETLSYTTPSVALFTQAGFGCSQSKSGVSYVRFEHYGKDSGPQAGLDRKVTFWGGASGLTEPQPRVNDDGAYGFEFEYGPSAHVSRFSLLSANGHPEIGRKGYASYALKYDRTGAVVEKRFFNDSGEPTLNQDGFATEHAIADDYGRRVAETYLDLGGKPVNASAGFATARFTRGRHGEIAALTYFDTSGIPTASEYGYASARFAYDSSGNRTKISYYDTSGQPTTNKHKVATYASTFDSYGNPVATDNYGVNGKLAFSDEAYVSDLITYDNRGNQVDHRFLGLAGELVVQKGGFAIVRQRFNDQNRRTDVQYFDPHGALTLNDDGYAEWHMEYDNNGSLIADKVLGIDGLPTLSNISIYKTMYQYNDNGLVIEERFTGLNDRPAATNEGGDASVKRYTYDAMGRKVKEAFFDINGGPAVVAGGYSSVRYQFDYRGRETEVAFFGPNEQPAKSNEGAFRIRQQFDDRGNATSEEYLDGSGDPMLSNIGVAAARFQPDRLGNVLSARYLGVALEPVLATKDSVAGWNSTYDEKGQQLNYESVGLHNELVAGGDQVVRTMYNHDAMGDLVGRRFYAADGKPMLDSVGVAGWTSKYNDRHQEIESTFIDAEGHPMVSPKLRYSTWHSNYDARGRVIEASYFGLDGRLALSNEGYAICRFVYDDRGNKVEQSFFDETDHPTYVQEAAKIASTYNKYGWEVERRFYGVDGRLIKNPRSGRAIVRLQYDDSGRVKSEASYDENDAPVDRRDLKYFKKASTYDQAGKESSVCTTTGGRIIKPCPKDD